MARLHRALASASNPRRTGAKGERETRARRCEGPERFGLVSEFLEGTTSRAKAENATWPRSVITGTGTPEEMEHGMNHRTLIARNRDHKQQNAKVHQVAKKYLGGHRTSPYGRALNYPPLWAIAFTHNGHTDTPQPTRSVGTGKGSKRVGGAGGTSQVLAEAADGVKESRWGRTSSAPGADGQECGWTRVISGTHPRRPLRAGIFFSL
jgi:hypothetical protein